MVVGALGGWCLTRAHRTRVATPVLGAVRRLPGASQTRVGELLLALLLDEQPVDLRVHGILLRGGADGMRTGQVLAPVQPRRCQPGPGRCTVFSAGADRARTGRARQSLVSRRRRARTSTAQRARGGEAARAKRPPWRPLPRLGDRGDGQRVGLPDRPRPDGPRVAQRARHRGQEEQRQRPLRAVVHAHRDREQQERGCRGEAGHADHEPDRRASCADRRPGQQCPPRFGQSGISNTTTRVGRGLRVRPGPGILWGCRQTSRPASRPPPGSPAGSGSPSS